MFNTYFLSFTSIVFTAFLASFAYGSLNEAIRVRTKNLALRSIGYTAIMFMINAVGLRLYGETSEIYRNIYGKEPAWFTNTATLLVPCLIGLVLAMMLELKSTDPSPPPVSSPE